MATLREYFDGDFEHTARLHVKLPNYGPEVEAVLLYDFSAHTCFVSCYVSSREHTLEDFLRLLEVLRPGKSQLALEGKVTIPTTRSFPGKLEVRNTNPFEMRVNFHGDQEWISISEIPFSGRIFIYSESTLNDADIIQLKKKGLELGQKVQFRSTNHLESRSKHENPLAFISHDSRDKEVARKIALALQKMMCPVWYDEFSLSVGANLRDSIETGLKKCKKCILVLSPHFFCNGGWTKKEFDSIFTREILEEKQLVLPVWYGVTKQSVYEYCPSLLNVKGVDWNHLGEEEVCRQLCRAVL